MTFQKGKSWMSMNIYIGLTISMSIHVWSFSSYSFLLFTSHTTCQFLNCACILLLLFMGVFACRMSETCSKNGCKKYTPVTTVVIIIFSVKSHFTENRPGREREATDRDSWVNWQLREMMSFSGLSTTKSSQESPSPRNVDWLKFTSTKLCIKSVRNRRQRSSSRSTVISPKSINLSVGRSGYRSIYRDSWMNWVLSERDDDVQGSSTKGYKFEGLLVNDFPFQNEGLP